MTDDIFDKIQDCIDNLEAIHGADLRNMWFKTAEEDDDLERWFQKKHTVGQRKIPPTKEPYF